MSDLTASQIGLTHSQADLVKVHIRHMVRAILNQTTVADLEQILTDRFYDFRVNSIPKEAVRELVKELEERAKLHEFEVGFYHKGKTSGLFEAVGKLNKLLEGDNNG